MTKENLKLSLDILNKSYTDICGVSEDALSLDKFSQSDEHANLVREAIEELRLCRRRLSNALMSLECFYNELP